MPTLCGRLLHALKCHFYQVHTGSHDNILRIGSYKFSGAHSQVLCVKNVKT
jgi:hypothetical protein